METLLILQPIADGIITPCGAITVISIIALIIGVAIRACCADSNYNWESEIKFTTSMISASKKALIASAAVYVLLLPPANAWDIYKNMLVYRGINSPTADKAIGNIDKLMDKLGIVIDKAGDAAVKKLDEVGDAAVEKTEQVVEKVKE